MQRLQQLQNLLQQDPDDAFLLFAIAKEYEKAGALEEARESYLRILKKTHGYSAAYYHLGKLLEQLGDRAAAAEIYKEGLQVTRAQNDLHAFSELQTALELLDDE